ncbi:aromatic ring-hydroxylating oxygenase subunit alpha [Nocardia aurea]|uniref:Aromatic ring-hydroxylating dioxygenase subunit alpha n=1 Tax=Nocardia aurea TaxID=2144174 RepID=A0ABV3FX07_9NOCA
MPNFAKPAEGSWTQHFPDLGTDPMSYEDSISPEHYELERAAIFERTWLNVGRVEQIPRKGNYFTKEIAAAGTTVVIVRGVDDEIRAFHNICRHCGLELVRDHGPVDPDSAFQPHECPQGPARDGEVTFVQRESEFLDPDLPRLGPTSIRCEIWEGFLFVNFDENATGLIEYLGGFAAGLQGYPFDRMTQVFTYRTEVASNWKLFMDAFLEFYHAPVLHGKQYVGDESRKLMNYGFEALHYDIDGPHGVVSSWGGMAPPKDLSMVKPIERILRSGNFGAWDRPDIPGLDPLPPGLNPSRHKAWGLDSYVFFPNFMMVVWAPGWYLTYHYWPTAYNHHIFDGTLYFVPPENATARLRQELAAVTFKEFALQDCNTLEATQRMLESRVVTHFPLNDQEILLRHLHKTAGEYVDAYRAGR